jgi:hypothetical protein
MLIGEEEDEPEDLQEQAKTQFEALARIVSRIPLVQVALLILFLEESLMYQYHDS